VRPFTVPNAISAIRIALVPVMLWLLVGRDDPVAAGWLLAVIGSTDWVDGYLARRLDQVSKVGEFLDPMADRLAVAGALIGGLVTGDLPTWFAWALLVRELGVGVVGLYLGLRHRAKITVRRLGKLATLGVYSALAWFLVGVNTTWLQAAAWIVGIPSLVMYYVVGVQYLGDFRSKVAVKARV
jgi:cardiolipin synthase